MDGSRGRWGRRTVVIGLVLVAACSSSPPTRQWRPAPDAAPPPAVPNMPEPTETFLGGQPAAIVTAGKLAYVADWHGLAIVEIAGEDTLRPLGRVATPGLARDVVLIGERAYVADGSSGVAVIDVSDPSSPRPLRHIGTRGTARRVAASPAGRVAAVGDETVSVFRDPDGEAVAEGLRLPGAPTSAAWIGERLYVAVFGHALIRVDISANGPRVGWEDRRLHRVRSIAARGSWLFAVTASKKLLVFDASDARPREVATLTLTKDPKSLHVVGDRLAIPGPLTKHGMLVDAADPLHPRLEAIPEIMMRSAAKAGESLLIIADDTPALRLVRAGDAPQTTATLHGARSGTLEPAGSSMWVNGQYVPVWYTSAGNSYLAGIDENATLRRFTIDEVGAANLELSTPPRSKYETISACGERLCALTSDKQICLVQVQRGTLVDVACADATGPPVSVAYQPSNDRVWIGTMKGQLESFSIGEGIEATSSVTIETPYPALTSLAIEGDTLVGLDGRAAVLHVIDIAGEWPDQRGRFLLQDRATDVALSGGIAFVAEERFGIQLVDVRTLGSPTELAWLPMDHAPLSVDVDGRPGAPMRVALALGEGGVALYTWDENDGLQLALASDTPGLATDVRFSHGSLWVADSSALLRFDVIGETP